MTAFHNLILFSFGAALIPWGGSLRNLRKSRNNLRLQGVVIDVQVGTIGIGISTNEMVFEFQIFYYLNMPEDTFFSSIQLLAFIYFPDDQKHHLKFQSTRNSS